MRTISLVLLSILIAACAARQRAPASLPSKATPEGAMAASAPAGTTTSASAAPVADHPADKSNVPDPNILKHGYKAVHLNGQLRYCRSQILTGTHFQNTVCLTETQVKAFEHGNQETLDQLGRAGGLDCHVYKCN